MRDQSVNGQSTTRSANRVEDGPRGSISHFPGIDPGFLIPASTPVGNNTSRLVGNNASTLLGYNASTLLGYNASISGSNNPAHGEVSLMRNYYLPQNSSSGTSEASDIQYASRASSVAPSMFAQSDAPAQWRIFTTHNTMMDHSHTEAFEMSTDYGLGHSTCSSSAHEYDDHLLSGMHSFDGTSFGTMDSFDGNVFDTNRPLGPTNSSQRMTGGSYDMESSFVQPQAQPYQQHRENYANAFTQQQQHQTQQFQAPQAGYRNTDHGGPHPHLDIPSTTTMLPEPNTELPTMPVGMEQQFHADDSQIQPLPSTSRKSPPTDHQTRNLPYLRPSTQEIPAIATIQRPQKQRQTAASTREQPNPGVVPPIRPALTDTFPSNTPARSFQAAKERPKGGRRKGIRLPEEKRQKSSKMRKITACWHCAMQRDPCDEGSPCSRCVMKLQKGQTYFLNCDRSKLPDFVHDFLPYSLTMDHQKPSIEDLVKDQVLEWDQLNPIDVYLTSGYGPALRWRLYEFKPRTDDLLRQLQYFQDPHTGTSHRFEKYSPPFGILKLDASDDSDFENYLDQLLDPDWLWSFGWVFYEEESQVDPDQFQAKLLTLMCTLFTQTQDSDLKRVLKDIIRMMVITYIMSHTLTILEETLPTVLNSVKHSLPGQQQKHTSPRLANRQLKFYFAVLRTAIYEKILKRQQQTLHTSGKKEESWLPSFCAMLGFAMVLEEIQRTIQIQADAYIARGEMTFARADAEARNACERIDERFKFLVGLFQYKYRDRKWGEDGSFGPATPRLRDPAAREFLAGVRELLEKRYDHLRFRRDVPFAQQNQCLYTSRLVARFLIPFLNLPKT